jgi:hypothetical protein
MAAPAAQGIGHGLADGAAHRAGLHAVYNHYLRCSRPVLPPETEDIGRRCAAVHHLLAH